MNLRPLLLALVAAGCARSFDRPAALSVDRARLPVDPTRTWTDTGDDPIRLQQPGARPTLPGPIPQIEEGHLANGVRVLLVTRHGLPIMTMGVVVSRGLVDAPPGQFRLMFSGMVSGSRSSSDDDFYGYLNAFGVETKSIANREYALFRMRTLPSLALGPARLNGEAVVEPSFDPESFDRLKTLQLNELVGGDDVPTELANLAAQSYVYPVNHPYRISKADVVAGIQGLTVDDAKKIHAAAVQKDDVTVIAAGDIEMPRLITLYEGTIGKMTGGARPRIKAPPANPPARVLAIVDNKAMRQDAIAVRFLGVPFTDPDYPALLVAALSLKDMLHTATRLERGSTYGVGARMPPLFGPAMVQLDWRTDPGGTGRALRDMMSAIGRLHTALLSSVTVRSEIASAPGMRVDASDTNLETLDNLATIAGLDMTVDNWNRLVARLQRVTPQMVMLAAQRYLDVNHMVLVVAGDATSLAPTLEDLGLGKPEIQ